MTFIINQTEILENSTCITLFNTHSKFINISVFILGSLFIFSIILTFIVLLLVVIYFITNFFYKINLKNFVFRLNRILTSNYFYTLIKICKIGLVIFKFLFLPFSFFLRKTKVFTFTSHFIRIKNIFFRHISKQSDDIGNKLKNKIINNTTSFENFFTQKSHFSFKKILYYYYTLYKHRILQIPLIEIVISEKVYKDLNFYSKKISDRTFLNLKEKKDLESLKHLFNNDNFNVESIINKDNLKGTVVFRIIHEEKKLYELLHFPIGIYLYRKLVNNPTVCHLDTVNEKFSKNCVLFYFQILLGIYIQFFHLIIKKIYSRLFCVMFTYLVSALFFYNSNTADTSYISLVDMYTNSITQLTQGNMEHNGVVQIQITSDFNSFVKDILGNISLDKSDGRSSSNENYQDIYTIFREHIILYKKKYNDFINKQSLEGIAKKLDDYADIIRAKFKELIEKYLDQGKSYEEAYQLAYQELIKFVKKLAYFLGVTLGDGVYIMIIILFVYRLLFFGLEQLDYFKNKESNEKTLTSDIIKRVNESHLSNRDGIFTVYFPAIEITDRDSSFPPKTIGERVEEAQQKIITKDKEYLFDVADPVTLLEEFIAVSDDTKDLVKERTRLELLKYDKKIEKIQKSYSEFENIDSPKWSKMYNFVNQIKKKEVFLGKTFENEFKEQYLKYLNISQKLLKTALREHDSHTNAFTHGVALSIGSTSALSDIHYNEFKLYDINRKSYKSRYGDSIDSTIKNLSLIGTKGGSINMDRLIIVSNLLEYIPLPRLVTLSESFIGFFRRIFSGNNNSDFKLTHQATDMRIMKDASTLMLIAGSLCGLSTGCGNRYIAACGSGLTLMLGLDNFGLKLDSYTSNDKDGSSRELSLLNEDFLERYTDQVLKHIDASSSHFKTPITKKNVFDNSLYQSIVSVILVDPVMTLDNIMYSKKVLEKLNKINSTFIFSSNGKDYKRIINMYDATLPCSNAMAWGIPHFYHVYLYKNEQDKEIFFPLSHSRILGKISFMYIGSAITYLELGAQTEFSKNILSTEKKELYIPYDSLQYEQNSEELLFELLIGCIVHFKQMKNLTFPLVKVLYSKISSLYTLCYIKDDTWKSSKKKKHGKIEDERKEVVDTNDNE